MNRCKFFLDIFLQASLYFSLLAYCTSYPLHYSSNVPHRPYISNGRVYPKIPFNEAPLIYTPQLSNYYNQINEKYPVLPSMRLQPSVQLQERVPQRYLEPMVQDELANLAAEDAPDYTADDYVDDSPNDVLYDEKWYDSPVGMPDIPESLGSTQQVSDAALTDLMISYFLNSLEKQAMRAALKDTEKASLDEEKVQSEKKKKKKRENSVSTTATTTASSSTQKTVARKVTETTSGGPDVKIATRGQKEYPLFRQPSPQEKVSESEKISNSLTKSIWPEKLDQISEMEDEESLRSLKRMKGPAKGVKRNIRDVLASQLKNLRRDEKKT